MNKILAAIDFSKTSDSVIEQASALGKALNAKLWILHVGSDETPAIAYETSQYTDFTPDFVSTPGDVQMARDITAEELKREHNELLTISSNLKQNGVDAQAVLLKGLTAKVIVEKARELGVEIIILGSHGHGLLHKTLLGSVSEAVMRHAPCNVMIVPASGD